MRNDSTVPGRGTTGHVTDKAGDDRHITDCETLTNRGEADLCAAAVDTSLNNYSRESFLSGNRQNEPVSDEILSSGAVPQAIDNYRVVHSGIDSLSVRVSRRQQAGGWYIAAADHWTDAMSDAGLASKRKPLFVDLPALGNFQVRKSRNPYAWSLSNPQVAEIRLWNPAKFPSANRSQTGHIMIDFRSVFLLREGMTGVRRVIAAVVALVYGEDLNDSDKGSKFNRLRRVDMARDCQMPRGWEFGWYELQRFVSRSKYGEQFPGLELLEHEKHERELAAGFPQGAPEDNKAPQTSHQTQMPSVSRCAAPSEEAPEPEIWRVIGCPSIGTAYFSKFSASCYARLYDKLASLSIQNKEYMRGIWQAAGWDGESPVWRTEYSMGGDFLRGIVDPETGEVVDARELEVFEGLASGIWQYLTRRWLRHTQPTGDRTHVARWKLSPWWTQITRPWDGDRDKITAIRRLRVLDLPDPSALIKQAMGCFASAAAINAADDRHRGELKRLASVFSDWAGSDDALDKQTAVRVARGITYADRLVRPREADDIFIAQSEIPAWMLEESEDGEPPEDFDPDDPIMAYLDRQAMIEEYGGT